MGLLIALMVAAAFTNIWVVVKMRRVSVPYAIVAFIFFPAAIFFLFAHRGDEDHDIKVPIVLTLVLSILFMLQLKKLDAQAVVEEEEEARRGAVVVAGERADLERVARAKVQDN